MEIKRFAGVFFGFCALLFITPQSLAGTSNDDGFGQTIQIYTNLHSYKDHPIWLLIIRDLDHNQVLPYLYEVTQENDFWLAFSYSRNYTITVSNMKFDPTHKRIRNFCNLEGRTMHNESLYITINGDLTANTDTYTCNVGRYKDSNFAVGIPDAQ